MNEKMMFESMSMLNNILLFEFKRFEQKTYGAKSITKNIFQIK